MGLLCLAPGLVSAEGSLRLELERAWRADPSATTAHATDQEAALVLEAARRSWWPSASLDSPALATVSGDEASSALGSTIVGSVVQKLPGGGSMSLGASQTYTKPLRGPSGLPVPTTVPTLTLGFTQPLAIIEEGSDTQRRLARLTYEKSLGSLFLATVRRAAALDTARVVLKARRKATEAAQTQSEWTALWETQGRATKTEVWKARRQADAARWAQEKATLELEAAEQEWFRSARAPAGSWGLEEVMGLEAEAATVSESSLEDQIAALEGLRADQEARREAGTWAPVLSASASSSKPDGRPWQSSAQVGLKWSTDALVLAPVARQKADTMLQRLAQTAQLEATARKIAKEARERHITKLASRLELLAAETQRQIQVVAETRTLVEGRQLPLAELATAEADAAQLEADRRTLLWEKIVLQLTP